MRDGCQKVILDTTCLFRNSAGCCCPLHQPLALDLCLFLTVISRATFDAPMVAYDMSHRRNGKRNVIPCHPSYPARFPVINLFAATDMRQNIGLFPVTLGRNDKFS